MGSHETSSEGKGIMDISAPGSDMSIIDSTCEKNLAMSMLDCGMENEPGVRKHVDASPQLNLDYEQVHGAKTKSVNAKCSSFQPGSHSSILPPPQHSKNGQMRSRIKPRKPKEESFISDIYKTVRKRTEFQVGKNKTALESIRYKILLEALECLFLARASQAKWPFIMLDKRKLILRNEKEKSFKDLGININTTRMCSTDVFIHILKCCFDLISPEDRDMFKDIWPIKELSQVTHVKRAFSEWVKQQIIVWDNYFPGMKPEYFSAVLQVPSGERYTRFLRGIIQLSFDHYIKRKISDFQSRGIKVTRIVLPINGDFGFLKTNGLKASKMQVAILKGGIKAKNLEIDKIGKEYLKKCQRMEELDSKISQLFGFHMDSTLEEFGQIDGEEEAALEQHVEHYLMSKDIGDFEFGPPPHLNNDLEDAVAEKKKRVEEILDEVGDVFQRYDALMNFENKRRAGEIKKYEIDGAKFLSKSETYDYYGKLNKVYNVLSTLFTPEQEELDPSPFWLTKERMNEAMMLKEADNLGELLKEFNAFEVRAKLEQEIQLLEDSTRDVNWDLMTGINFESGWAKCLENFGINIKK